jgi:hypothetical protein
LKVMKKLLLTVAPAVLNMSTPASCESGGQTAVIVAVTAG